MRQTDLSLNRIIFIMENDPQVASCLCIHEIGSILFENGPESKGAEEYLFKLLDAGGYFDQCLAYAYLKVYRQISEDSRTKLKKFEDHEDNRYLVEWVNKIIRTEKFIR